MNLEIITGVFLFICVGLFLYFYYFGNNDENNHKSDDTVKIVEDEQFLKFKQAFQNQKSILTPDNYKKMDEYKFNQNDPWFADDAESWKDDDSKMKELIQFGFNLLNKYAEDSTCEQCLKISTDIVLRVGRIVNRLLEINVVHAKKSEHKGKKGKGKREINEDDIDGVNNKMKQRDTADSGTKKKIDRFIFSVYIPKLMVMYEYIGNDGCIKKYVCHPIITKMIHALNKPLDKIENDSNMVQYAFPRLLSNYLFDRETYTAERNGPLFEELCKFYNIKYNLSADGPKNGLYEDGSCLYHDSVPRYSNLFILPGFYENIFASFGIDYNFHDIVDPIIDKLFHPDIPYVTFGLYGDNGERTKNMKGKLGIAIMPYIGLGLFKADHFMFSLRIQRPGIAAFFKSSNDSEDIFALGWIQLRKMYLKNMSYPQTLTWDLLTKEPGIILFDDQNEWVNLTLTSHKSNIYTEEMNSFIGRIPNENVMFWMNKYRFTEYYNDIIITEMGVVTDNGVEIFYCTNKNSPDGKKLLLRVKDPDNSILYCEPESNDGLAQLTKKGLTLRMVFDKTKTVNVQRNLMTKNMEFEYNSKKYTIKVLDLNSKYMVKVTHNDNLIEIFGGNSKSELNDTMEVPLDTGESKILQRSQVTYMYVY